jgi:hypothetical protein
MGEVGESSEKPDEGWSQYHRMILPRSANVSFSYHHFKGGNNVTNATNLLSFVLRRFSGETPPGAKSEPFAGLIPAIQGHLCASQSPAQPTGKLSPIFSQFQPIIFSQSLQYPKFHLKPDPRKPMKNSIGQRMAHQWVNE